MGTKEAFHKLIDKIEDEAVLRSYFELIQRLNSKQTGALWNALNDDEKKELLAAYDESFDPQNLISNEEVKKQLRKWLEK